MRYIIVHYLIYDVIL